MLRFRGRIQLRLVRRVPSRAFEMGVARKESLGLSGHGQIRYHIRHAAERIPEVDKSTRRAKVRYWCQIRNLNAG
jgi:hypothetical protein